MIQLGVFRLAFLLILYAFLLAILYKVSKDKQNAAFVSGIWAFLLASIHARRSDKRFLCINMAFDKLIYSSEYIVLSVPLIVCLLLRRQWLLAAGLALFCLIIGCAKVNWRKQQRTWNTRLQRYIPSAMYEWKAGVRRYLVPLIAVWLSGLCLGFFVAGIPVAMLIIGILMFDFYKTNESWQMLISHQKNAGKLLLYKITQHSLLYTALNLPLILLFLIFHLEKWYIAVVLFVILLSIHIFCIVLKYAFYSHDSDTVNPAFQATGILVGLIPLSTPLLWLFSIYLLFKAKTNLYPYLNDYD